jgi:hypothetical protein
MATARFDLGRSRVDCRSRGTAHTRSATKAIFTITANARLNTAGDSCFCVVFRSSIASWNVDRAYGVLSRALVLGMFEWRVKSQ